MDKHRKSWMDREARFSAFVAGPLKRFWSQRQEKTFTSHDGKILGYVSLTGERRQRLIVIAPGRGESYLKYAEVLYDLFYCGYDLLVIDHRGQGVSERMLQDNQRGHVERFSDYVDDLQQLCQLENIEQRWPHRFLLSHSMGGAIASLLCIANPKLFKSTALLAPMMGIALPVPEWIASRILHWTEDHSQFRDSFALGTGRWIATPFAINNVTHSRLRYKRNIQLCSDAPRLQLGGPSAHWVKEAMDVGKQILEQAASFTTPVLLLQAEEDVVVDNQAQRDFCQQMADLGKPLLYGHPFLIYGARHEILFEIDAIRGQALNQIIDFFDSF